MFFSDPLYLIVMVIGMALSFLPQMILKGVYRQYADVPNKNGMTGAQVALDILAKNGLHDVSVEMTPGELSDHYDPSARAVRLSLDHFSGRSVAGAAIAAHEVGHAIQHATGYYPVVIRSNMFPVVNLASGLAPIMLMVSMGIGVTSQAMPDWAYYLAWLGVLMFGASVAFHLVTLPVEFNASMRATHILENSRYLTTEEMPGAKKVLIAAAFTYVAAALYALIQLLYYVFRLSGMSRSSSSED